MWTSLKIDRFDVDSNTKYAVLAVFIEFVVNFTLSLSFLLKALSSALIKFSLFDFSPKTLIDPEIGPIENIRDTYGRFLV